MKREIPDFMLELSKQMNTQPNLMTSEPFWQVRCKRLVPTEQGYSDVCFEIVGEDGPVWNSASGDLEQLYSYFNENHNDWFAEITSGFEDHFYTNSLGYFLDFYDPENDEIPDNMERVYLQEVEEVVWTGLTQDAAQQFIKRKQHDYPKLYTWVDSAYWSPQFAQLMQWVKGLMDGEQK